MTLPMLCVDEPYATAIMLGLKRWETRTAPPNGDMRPEGVRGFPGVRVNRGDRIIIAATARAPKLGRTGPWKARVGASGITMRPDYAPDTRIPMYPGHILGTVTVTDAVEIVEHTGLPDKPVVFSSSQLLWKPHVASTVRGCVDISDQLPWGDWRPGRSAWALDDPIPTTEQCPLCFGDGGFKEDSMLLYGVPGGEDWAYGCPVCEGEGRCDPIPVTGHQGLRVWNGEVRR